MTALNAFNMGKGRTPGSRLELVLDQMGQSIYGYSVTNQKWYTGNLARFWVPVGGGAIAHWGANMLGINRILARAKLGFTI